MRRKDMVEHFLEAASRTGAPILNQSLVEICGGHRVLIEHHVGIGEYSGKVVCVKVPSGAVEVCGNNLEICKMTADQLIITGDIHTINLRREDGA
jgi:sporulation protein YqfC